MTSTGVMTKQRTTTDDGDLGNWYYHDMLNLQEVITEQRTLAGLTQADGRGIQMISHNLSLFGVRTKVEIQRAATAVQARKQL